MSYEVLDKHLSNIAKAMIGATYTYPAYFAQGSTAVTVTSTDTSLTGEFGSRFVSASTINAAGTGVDYSGIASGTAILQSTGTTIKSLALFSASTSGDMHIEISIPSITQTTNFDINWVVNLGYTRV